MICAGWRSRDHLVNLFFQRVGAGGGRMCASDERTGARQITFGLCDRGLCHWGIDVVRRNIGEPDQTFAGPQGNDEVRRKKTRAG